MSLDRKTVAHIATLARIRLEPKEADALAGELEGILRWVEQLNEVDVSGVAPMSGVEQFKLPQRKDAVTDGGDRDRILANAPEAAAGFFAVPKVVE
ncbi:MAG: Asp-tRNA(Asn)/Glu-tRNA(Gln) amidotransferase subunit GatC [Dongiaceae bacterium]